MKVEEGHRAEDLNCWAVKQTFDNGNCYVAIETVAHTRSIAIDKAIRGWSYRGDIDDIIRDKKARTQYWKQMRKDYGLAAVKINISEVCEDG